MGTAKAQRRIHAQQAFRFGTAAGNLAFHFVNFVEDPLSAHQIEFALRCKANATGRAIE
ncbi:hypothetical protein D3C80_1707140 [compost metagenome]